MNIAILTPGVLPVPTVRGGAVEMLTECLLDYNEQHLQHDITIYGIYDAKITKSLLNKYKYCHFELFNQNSLRSKIKRFIYSKTTSKNYYNHYLDYYAYQALKKISCKKNDILLIENRANFVLMASTITNIPIVLHLHNDTLDAQTINANDILSKSTKILTVSGYIKKRVDTIDTTNDKVHVVYNGIDIDRFKNINPVYSRKDFGFDNDDFVLVYTGRLDPIKGVKELLQSFLLLNQEKIKLLIVGGSNYGNSSENEYTQEIKSLVSNLGNRVVFTGHLPYESIPAILSLCDIGVIPSICEDALTLSSIEDMAVGLPLIVTRSGGIPEAVDEECAIIIEKDETMIEKLAQSILLLYSDKDKQEKMSIHAKQRALLFNKDNYAKNIFKELEL
ncbi:glycosyltransferase family 1 protein [Bacteroides sp. 214]|uniref:glycosyltransferase family 4 protein n=1 Tax=Bacteroides sp. 214 TaxID=2302935 RepID=UPI0013D22241|nr:glycosyltransferase family 4 protein [Bacteroides sp. 214]NDW12749.1 glycosyltransferase family 1 protein [Bacteroides sp. 214]